jgi:hypothetical protein
MHEPGLKALGVLRGGRAPGSALGADDHGHLGLAAELTDVLAQQVDPLVALLIAFIEQPEVIEKILTHLGLWPAQAHSPPAGVATGLIAA